MSESKKIAVIGATGAQGGGLARKILDTPEAGFSLRALTRSPDSDTARALSDAGAEVVSANLDDEASLEAAFEGCHGLFAVTNFWEHFSPEKEIEQAGHIARAAKAAGVEHVVWSTLEDTRKWIPIEDDRMPTLMEKFSVPHFDSKGEADQIFRDVGVPTTFLVTSFYWDNLIHFGSEPQRGEDGGLIFPLPMGDRRLPGIAVEDIGRCAFGVFRRPDLIGETVGIAGEHLTGAEMAAALTDAMGEPVTYVPLDFDTYRSFDFPGAEDLGNMFQFMHDFNEDFTAARSVEFSRSLNPDLMAFRGWLSKHADRIPRH